MSDESGAQAQNQGGQQQGAQQNSQSDGTMAGGGSGDQNQQGQQEQQSQPDWRVELAVGADGKTDEKALERLKRFNSRADVWKAYRELEGKVTSGQLKSPTPFPKDGKPEEQAAWRKANGLPEDAKGYKLPETISLSEADKPIVESFLNRALGRNLDNETVSDLTTWFFEARAKEAEARTANDRQAWTETQRELKQKWGTEEFEVNKALYSAFLQSAPEGVREAINAARGPDGKKLGGNPAFLEWAVGLARAHNIMDSHTIVAGVGTGGMDSVVAEIEKIEGIMRTDRNRYNSDVPMQERLRKLYAVRDAAKPKAA